jgi:hypothetical protein
MTADFQAIAALLIVALTATWFIARAVAKRKAPGCGGDCGCASSEIKKRGASLR